LQGPRAVHTQLDCRAAATRVGAYCAGSTASTGTTVLMQHVALRLYISCCGSYLTAGKVLGTETTSCCSRLSSGRTVVLPGAPALSLAICLHLHRYIQQISLKTPKTSCNICTQHCGTHRIAVSILPLAPLCLPPRSPPCSASPSSSPWSPRRHSCTASSLTAAQPVPSAGAAAAGVATMQPRRTQTRTRAPQPFCSCFEPERQGI
jgi:hypothetical protein